MGDLDLNLTLFLACRPVVAGPQLPSQTLNITAPLASTKTKVEDSPELIRYMDYG